MSPLIWIFLVFTFVLFFATVVLSLNDRLALRWLRWRVKRTSNRLNTIVLLLGSVAPMGLFALKDDSEWLFLSLLFVSGAMVEVTLRAFAMLYAEESPPAKG